MLIKQLIESEEIDGQDAIWAMAALGYHAKTPTGDLLRQLVVNYRVNLILKLYWD